MGSSYNYAEIINIASTKIEKISSQDEWELNAYFAPMVVTNHLYDDLVSSLEDILKDKNLLKKSAGVLNTLKLIRKLSPQVDEKGVLAHLLSLWLIHSFYDHEVLDTNYLTDEKLVWKSRYVIINNMLVWWKKLIKYIEIKFAIIGGVEFDDTIKKFLFYALVFLVDKSLLKEKIITNNNKSVCFISCGGYIIKYNFFYQYKIFLKKPTLVWCGNVYFCGSHYSSIYEVLHTNWKNKKPTQLNDLDFLKKLNTIKYHIDWEVYDEIKKTLQKIWFGDSIFSLQDLYEKIYTTRKLMMGKLTQRFGSKLYMYLVFWEISKLKNILKNGFYLIYFLDFRGRIYSHSTISPIGNRLFRYLYSLGVYSKKEVANFTFDNLNLKSEVVEIFTTSGFKLSHPNINLNCDVSIYYIFTAFFEFGKIFKKKYLEKFNGKLSLKNFLQIGVVEYFNFNIESEQLETILEYLYIKNILTKANRGEFSKIIIYKDATASAIQLLMLVLGAAKDDGLEICNLTNNTCWVDTYYHIINLFKSSYNFTNPTLSKYFTRSSLKKTIMTYNYEATLWRCYEEFTKEVGPLPENEVKQLRLDFTAFYKFLKNLFDGGGFYKRPSREIIEVYKSLYLKTGSVEYLTFDKILINLDYYKITSRRFEKKINKKRYTISYVEVSDEKDENKMFRALRANIIHSLDAYIARAVVLNMPCPTITIHDSYGTDILNWYKLIAVVQEHYDIIANQNNIISDVGRGKIFITSEFILI